MSNKFEYLSLLSIQFIIKCDTWNRKYSCVQLCASSILHSHLSLINGTHDGAQIGLQLAILLLSLKCWTYRHSPLLNFYILLAVF